jgi:hypothetical protein
MRSTSSSINHTVVSSLAKAGIEYRSLQFSESCDGCFTYLGPMAGVPIGWEGSVGGILCVKEIE